MDEGMVLHFSLCVGAAGLTMMVLALVGHRIAAQCFSITVVTVKNKKRFFNFLSFMMILCLSIFRENVVRSLIQVSSDVSHAMERGMTAYLLDKHWRSSWDQMQFQMKCCGASNYTDWYRISWIRIESLNSDAPRMELYVRPNGLVTAPLLPFSCCRTDYLGVCQHDLLSPRVKTPGSASFYTHGCVKLVTRILLDSVNWFTELVVCCALAVIVGSVLLSFLFTSSRNALILGRDIGPGWLYGPEDVGYGAEDSLISIDATEEENEKNGSSVKNTFVRGFNLNDTFDEWGPQSDVPQDVCRNGSGKYLCDAMVMQNLASGVENSYAAKFQESAPLKSKSKQYKRNGRRVAKFKACTWISDEEIQPMLKRPY